MISLVASVAICEWKINSK